MTISLKFPLLMALTSLAACAGESPSRLQEDAAVVKYYLGEAKTTSDQGEEAIEDIVIVHRSLRTENRIEVLAHTWQDLDYVSHHFLNLTPVENTLEFTVDGRFLAERVVGLATVDGQPFGRWAGWQFTGSLPNQSDLRVESATTLSAAGAMVVNTDIYYKDDATPFVEIDESLVEQDPNDPAFAALLARVTGTP